MTTMLPPYQTTNIFYKTQNMSIEEAVLLKSKT